MRLDQYLAERLGLSRNRAQFLIDSGLVFIGGKTVSKPSFDVAESDHVEVREDPRLRYVARSAVKLADFLAHLESQGNAVLIDGKKCLDVGASTGGFTQVLLEAGAASVHGVDVGTDQLHPLVREDARVVSLENTDIRSWQYDGVFDVATVDVSFISLREILPHASRFLVSGGKAVVLFKPQFEVGRNNLRKTGVPKDYACVRDAMERFRASLPQSGFTLVAERPSTLAGEAWNQEFLFLLERK